MPDEFLPSDDERASASQARSAGERGILRRFLSSRADVAFEDVCKIQIPRLLKYFEGRGCQPPLAEDLTQEVMLAVYRGAGTLRESGAFHGWMFAIARNLLLQYWRRRKGSMREVGLDSLDLEPQAVDPEEPAELSERFTEWMQLLEPPERQVMKLRFVDDLEYHEIAATLSIPIGTVKWRIFNSRAKLLKHFGPKGDGKC